MLDPDTAFRGKIQTQVENLGIIYDLCPAEAHWMIGMVERRNSILRCILEKLVDQFAIMDVESLGKILPFGLHAVNSSTFTRESGLSGCLWSNTTTTRWTFHR